MTIKYNNEELQLRFGRYENGSRMISLELYTTGAYPEPYMTASFNPEYYPQGEGKDNIMAVKDWSENEGIEKALLDNEIITKKVDVVPAGYVSGNVYEVNKKFLTLCYATSSSLVN